MPALIDKKILAPGETVGLLELTGGTPGTLYAIMIQSSGARIVASHDSTESYPIDNQRTYLTDTEILVKNVSREKISIRAVALAKGDGGSTGTTAVGEVILPPGGSVGVLEAAGATPGNLYSVSILGDRLGMVSDVGGAVSFSVENQAIYVTNEEIFVRNLTNTSDRVSILAIPAVPPSAGGGGGVSTVNGQSGDVFLSLSQLADEGVAMTPTPIAVVDDMLAPARYISLVPTQGIGALYNGELGNRSGILAPGGLTLSDSATGGGVVIPPASGTNLEFMLPSSSGTLIAAPPVPATGTHTLRAVEGVVTWVEEV